MASISDPYVRSIASSLFYHICRKRGKNVITKCLETLRATLAAVDERLASQI